MHIPDLYTKVRSHQNLAAAHKAVARINSEEGWAQSLTDAQLASSFAELKNVSAQERQVKGFALVREAARRSLGLRHFDVQMVGGLTLLQGKLAEMKTGEGKTLTITSPAAVLALEGKGVHVVTANSYLAQRDAELMRPVYAMLGLSVSAIHDAQSLAEKKAAYLADVTYGVGSEFGFDYLKDNLALDESRVVQRGLYAAIVDEVDSILIDEARVPLIISDIATDMTEVVQLLDACVKNLTPELHYTVDIKERHAHLTEAGYAAVEGALVASGALPTEKSLYEPAQLPWVRRLHSAVKAYALYRKNRDYVVEGGKVVLVDLGTGRAMDGRRLEDGLHEALEAREGVAVQRGTVVKATVTYQNFFALYQRLGGLTGTALTEAEEFSDIYGLETVVIPTNKPIQRKQAEDLVFLTKAEKFNAVVAEARARSAKGQPVLIGVGSIRDAEVLDKLLTAGNVAHETLTAKHIEREAHIIAKAGTPGAVTVATNMAGRGTDILLGGEKPAVQDHESTQAFEAAMQQWAAARDTVLAAGGLFVLGAERNGIRRVDNQLAGRSGRQGDPGEVQFMLSLEDELLQVFGRSRQLTLVRKLIEASGSALGGKTVARLITQAQTGLENQGFSARKSLMQYDKVLSDQRLAVYALRQALLRGDAKEQLHLSVLAAVDTWLHEHMPEDSLPEQWPVADLKRALLTEFGLNVPLLGWVSKDGLAAKEVAQRVREAAEQRVQEELPDEEGSRLMLLTVLDQTWTDHLAALDELKNNVSLKTKTGFNPMFQFGKDAFELFKSFERETNFVLATNLLSQQKREAAQALRVAQEHKRTAEQSVALALEKRWVTRNEPCPCNSGLRYKDCHGKLG